jgi:hypothetical protein
MESVPAAMREGRRDDQVFRLPEVPSRGIWALINSIYVDLASINDD